MTIWLDWDLLLLFLSLSPSHFLSPAGQLERVLLFYFNWGSDVIGLLHAGLFNLDPSMCAHVLWECVHMCRDEVFWMVSDIRDRYSKLSEVYEQVHAVVTKTELSFELFKGVLKPPVPHHIKVNMRKCITRDITKTKWQNKGSNVNWQDVRVKNIKSTNMKQVLLIQHLTNPQVSLQW